MTCVAPQQQKILSGPRCEKCGGITRVITIAAHPRLRRRHVWKLECMSCGTEHDAEMPAPNRTH